MWQTFDSEELLSKFVKIAEKNSYKVQNSGRILTSSFWYDESDEYDLAKGVAIPLEFVVTSV